MRHFKFIGGPWDGEYHDMDCRDYIDVCKPSTFKPLPVVKDGSEDHFYDGAFTSKNVTRYTLRHFASAGGSFFYYADVEWSDRYVISQLVHHYGKS